MSLTPCKTSDWAERDIKAPVIIRMGLRPIPNLFTAEFLGRHGIDVQHVFPWFLQKFLNHCNEVQ